MPRVLVTGMSATGKSTVIAGVRARGVRAVDLDDEGVVVLPDGRQLWDEGYVRALLHDTTGQRLVVAGCEENMGQFLADFDAVVLLCAPADVLVERLASRTTNDFGKSTEERARVLRDLAEVEPLLRRVATVEIDSTARIDDVVEQVLALA